MSFVDAISGLKEEVNRLEKAYVFVRARIDQAHHEIAGLQRNVPSNLEEATKKREEIRKQRQIVSDGEVFIRKLEEWANKSFGVIRGYGRELLTAMKHTQKQRRVGFERADVTIEGTSGSFSIDKAVQLKSTISAVPGGVDEMLKKAYKQVTGNSRATESPLAGERKIIDIEIVGNNPWPFDSVFSRASSLLTLGALVKKGQARILEKLGGVNLATHPQLDDILDTDKKLAITFGKFLHTPSTPFGQSRTTKVYRASDRTFIDIITIKIRYVTPYSVNAVTESGYAFEVPIRKLVYAVYMSPPSNQLQCQVLFYNERSIVDD
jgi:hypothetical protein